MHVCVCVGGGGEGGWVFPYKLSIKSNLKKYFMGLKLTIWYFVGFLILVGI